LQVQTVKIGLIGAGRIGLLHAANLRTRIPEAELVMVTDVAVEAARQCAERYAIPSYGKDYRAILDHPEIQAVVICSSTHTHARIIEEAAQAGKHIFCEKPIALNLPVIDQVLERVKSAGVKLQIGFNRRFDANFQRVRQAIEQSEIGQARQLQIISRDPAPPPQEYIRTSGGIFLDMAIHDFDMARFLLGDEVEEVFVLANALDSQAIAEEGDVDNAIIMLQFSGGAIGTIYNNRSAAYGYDQRVEVLGNKGAIAIGNNYPNTAIISDANCVRRDLPLYFFIERYTESYVVEMAAFIEAVLHDKPVPVTGYDGRVPVAIALTAQRSLAEHRAVRLSEIEE
jgi:myo-inositol 2-dehydrogenase/D-chiro-inositol 1-dehydrogenase